MTDDIKHTLDGVSVTSALTAFAGWLPDLLASIAAFLAIVWTGIRIYEWWSFRKRHPRRRWDD